MVPYASSMPSETETEEFSGDKGLPVSDELSMKPSPMHSFSKHDPLDSSENTCSPSYNVFQSEKLALDVSFPSEDFLGNEGPRTEMEEESMVVLLGKIGHGKSRVANLLCGESFESNMGNDSCTRKIQKGKSIHRGIVVIDTPGFYSCKDTQGHIDQQRAALEGAPLNGVFVVVKFGRSDDIVDTVSQVMDFCSSDDIRILITHADIAATDDDFDPAETRDLLSEYLDVPTQNIAFVGKRDEEFPMIAGILTTPEDLEDFVFTSLHKSRSFEVSADHSAYILSRSAGARQFDSELQVLYEKIGAAQSFCESIHAIVDSGVNIRRLDALKKAAVCAVQKLVKNVAKGITENISGKTTGLSASDLNTIDANLNVDLKLHLDAFLANTDKFKSENYSSCSLIGPNVRSGQSRIQSYESIFRQCTLNANFELCPNGQIWRVKLSNEEYKEIKLNDIPKIASEIQLTRKSHTNYKRQQRKRKVGLIVSSVHGRERIDNHIYSGNENTNSEKKKQETIVQSPIPFQRDSTTEDPRHYRTERAGYMNVAGHGSNTIAGSLSHPFPKADSFEEDRTDVLSPNHGHMMINRNKKSSRLDSSGLSILESSRHSFAPKHHTSCRNSPHSLNDSNCILEPTPDSSAWTQRQHSNSARSMLDLHDNKYVIVLVFLAFAFALQIFWS